MRPPGSTIARPWCATPAASWSRVRRAAASRRSPTRASACGTPPAGVGAPRSARMSLTALMRSRPRRARLVLATDFSLRAGVRAGEDGRVRQRLTLPGKVYMHAWAFDPAGTHLACAWLTDRQAKEFALFDLATGRGMAQFAPVREEIRDIAFSPDGRRLVTGSDDCLVRVWDAAGGTFLQTFEGHTGLIKAVAFGPDGRVVVSGLGGPDLPPVGPS